VEQVLTNSMTIWNAEGRMIGNCLDIVGSFMNHCCDPSAFVFHEGKEIRVRSLKLIRAGEEITQSYFDVDVDVLVRQKGLQEKYFFFCEFRYPLNRIIIGLLLIPLSRQQM